MLGDLRRHEAWLLAALAIAGIGIWRFHPRRPAVR